MARPIIVFAVAALMGACNAQTTAPAPQQLTADQMSRLSLPEWCQQALTAANHPFATPVAQAMVLETMRNRGCFGPAQPQTVIIR
jgi:hypothetical protein